MPPKGAAQRAEQAAAVAAAMHAQASDPRIPAWIAAAGPQDPAGAVNLAEAARLHARATRIPRAPRRRAGARRGRGAGRLGGGAGGERLRRLRAGAGADARAQAGRGGVPRGGRAVGVRRAPRRLRAGGDGGGAGGALRDAAAGPRGRCARGSPRPDGRRRPSPGPFRATGSWRCRGGSGTSSATTGRRGGWISRCIPPPPARAGTCGSPPASTRRTRGSASTRPCTRSGMRSTSRGSTRRRRCCRRARAPRWGCTRASRGSARTSSGAAGPSAPGSGRRCATPSARWAWPGRRRSTARSTRWRPASSAPRRTRSTTTCT